MLDALTQPFSIATPTVPLWQFTLIAYAVGFLLTFIIDARRGSGHTQAEGTWLAIMAVLWPLTVPLRVLYGLARIGVRR